MFWFAIVNLSGFGFCKKRTPVMRKSPSSSQMAPIGILKSSENRVYNSWISLVPEEGILLPPFIPFFAYERRLMVFLLQWHISLSGRFVHTIVLVSSPMSGCHLIFSSACANRTAKRLDLRLLLKSHHQAGFLLTGSGLAPPGLPRVPRPKSKLQSRPAKECPKFWAYSTFANPDPSQR